VSLPVIGQAGGDSPGVTPENLPALLEKTRAKHDVPALAAGIIREGDKPHVAVVGVRKRGKDALATADDQWHLGSNTKPFTALLIALLVDQGRLDWDTPLEDIFPGDAEKWCADLKSITPAHLLTHTSGLPPTGPLLAFLIGRSQATPVQDREKLVKSLALVKLRTKPGEKYLYSNLGYVVLGAIVDRRGEASWEEQLEKKVFQPLEIKRWGVGPMEREEALAHPWPHQSSGKPVPAEGVRDNPPVLNSAGRIRMTVADYTRFLAEILNLARGDKGLLKPATAQRVFTNPYPVSPHSLSAWVGFRKRQGDKGLTLGHDGSNSFNYCTALVVPDQNLAFCVLSNQGGPAAEACHEVQKELWCPTGSPKE